MKAPRLSDLPRSGPLFFCDLVQKHEVFLVVTSHDRSIFVLHTQTAKILQHLENIHALRYQITLKPNDLLQGAEQWYRVVSDEGQSLLNLMIHVNAQTQTAHVIRHRLTRQYQAVMSLSSCIR